MDKSNSQGPKKIIALPWYLFISVRPRQWIKNLAVFAALVFSGDLVSAENLVTVFWGFVLFCILTSSTYLLNDLVDAKRDRLHPFKKFRPIAKGVLPPILALLVAILGIASSLYLGYQLFPFFFLTLLAYFILQVIYTLFLKQVILLDVMAIASGYLLRVYSGALLINAHITVWFILAVTSLSLFLAIGKRRSELTLLSVEQAPMPRRTLLHYPETLLDSLVAMFSTATWLTYAIFTFLEPPPSVSPTVLILLSDYLPRTLLASKWLMLTLPFVIYGVMRYLYVIYEKKQGESPEKVLLSDLPLLTTVILWGLSVLIVIYWLGPQLQRAAI